MGFLSPCCSASAPWCSPETHCGAAVSQQARAAKQVWSRRRASTGKALLYLGLHGVANAHDCGEREADDCAANDKHRASRQHDGDDARQAPCAPCCSSPAVSVCLGHKAVTSVRTIDRPRLGVVQAASVCSSGAGWRGECGLCIASRRTRGLLTRPSWMRVAVTACLRAPRNSALRLRHLNRTQQVGAHASNYQIARRYQPSRLQTWVYPALINQVHQVPKVCSARSGATVQRSRG